MLAGFNIALDTLHVISERSFSKQSIAMIITVKLNQENILEKHKKLPYNTNKLALVETNMQNRRTHKN